MNEDISKNSVLVVGGLSGDLKNDWASNDTAKFLRGAGYPVDLIEYDDISATIISQLKHSAVVVSWHESDPHFSKDVDVGTALFEFAASGRLVVIFGAGGPKLERVLQTWFRKEWRLPRIDFRGRFVFKTSGEDAALPSPYRVKVNPATNVAAIESPYSLSDDVSEQASFLGMGLSPVVVSGLESGGLAYIGDWNADEPSMKILARLLVGPIKV